MIFLSKIYYLTIGILFILLILPLIGIISKINFGIEYLFQFFENKYNIKIIFITFFQATLSSIISCLIAIPFALSLYRNRNLKIIKFIASLCGYCFVIPSILIVYSVVGIFGTNGFLNNLFNFYNILNLKTIFGLEAIILAHVLLNAPFAARIFYQNLNTISKNYFEISKSINLGFWGNIIKIEWPILKQNFFSTFSIIFILCFLSFAIVMTLGGGPKTSTLEVAIYQSVFYELNFNKAIIFSIIQIIICFILLLFGFFKLRGSHYFEYTSNHLEHPARKKFYIKYLDYVTIFIFSIILFSPIIFISINFLELIFFKNFYFKSYFFEALKNSIILSFFTGTLVTFLGLTISLLLVNLKKNIIKQQILFLISSIILVISPVIISLGYFIILDEMRYFYIITNLVIITINCIFLLPFAILILFVKLKNIFLNFEDIKETFRINNKNYIIIIFPLIKQNLIYIFAFTSAISFGDFTVISFFKNESYETLPILLYKLIGSYRFEEASFVAGFILVFSLFLYLTFDARNQKDKPAKTT